MSSWLFQANPTVWDLFGYLRDHPSAAGEEWRWSCLRYRDRVSNGDRLVLWVSGDPRTRGVYAVGRLTGEPAVGVDDDGYWRDRDRGRRARWYVPMRFDRWLLEHPVLAVDLRADARFADASIFRTPRAANPHPLNPAQWDAIVERLPPA